MEIWSHLEKRKPGKLEKSHNIIGNVMFIHFAMRRREMLH